jgi:hypothetical protein
VRIAATVEAAAVALEAGAAGEAERAAMEAAVPGA